MPALRSPQHSLPPTPSTKGSGKSLSGQESLNDIDGSMSHEDMDRCKDVFRAYDKDGAGTLGVKEMRAALVTVTHKELTDEDLYELMAQIDEDGSNEFDLKEFCRAVQIQRSNLRLTSEADTLDAFIALGGREDGTGAISAARLRRVLKEFGLSVNVDSVVKESEDESGEKVISLAEFRKLFVAD